MQSSNITLPAVSVSSYSCIYRIRYLNWKNIAWLFTHDIYVSALVDLMTRLYCHLQSTWQTWRYRSIMMSSLKKSSPRWRTRYVSNITHSCLYYSQHEWRRGSGILWWFLWGSFRRSRREGECVFNLLKWIIVCHLAKNMHGRKKNILKLHRVFHSETCCCTLKKSSVTSFIAAFGF